MVLNNNETKTKGVKLASLKDIFDALASGSKSRGRLTIRSVEVCSSNKGCSPKSTKGIRDYLVAYIDEKHTAYRLAAAGDPTKYTVMFIDAGYKIGSVECSTSIRVPPSGVIKVSIGLSAQSEIDVTEKSDAVLLQLVKSITKDVLGILGIKQVRPTKLVSMNTEGYNLFNTDGVAPNHKIMNLGSLAQQLAEQLKGYYFDYNEREGRAVPRVFLKPLERGALPTIGVTTRGSVGMSGGTSLKQLQDTARALQRAFDKSRGGVVLSFDVPPSKTVKKGQGRVVECPKGIPAPDSAGGCEKGRVPRPNAKTKGLCCYKGRLTAAVSKEIRKYYNDARKPMPPALKKRIDAVLEGGRGASVKGAKEVRFSCGSRSLAELREMAKSLGVSPKGKKADLCARLLEALRPPM